MPTVMNRAPNAANVTPGPWHVETAKPGYRIVSSEYGGTVATVANLEDAMLIVQARDSYNPNA